MTFEHNWQFETTEQLQSIFEGGYKKLNNLIVDTAIANLKTRKKEIPVVSIYTKDEDMFYDIIIERPDMIETLEQNLKSMEEYEDYERCTKIQQALNYLKNKIFIRYFYLLAVMNGCFCHFAFMILYIFLSNSSR